MRFNEFVEENPGTSFSQGFKQGFDKTDKLFKPSTWGKGSSSTEKTSTKSYSDVELSIQRQDLRDAQEIFDAVIKGNVGNLNSRQISLAKDFLNQLNNS